MHIPLPVPPMLLKHLAILPLPILLDLPLLALNLGTRLLQIRPPPRVRAVLAPGTLGAESDQVIHAQLPPHVLLATPRTERTEALVVVRAGRQLGLRVNVQVQALLAVGAVPVAHEEVALGHLAEVVLVQELARLALFAEAAEPVLADQGRPARRVRGAGGGVAVRAGGAEGAVACQEGLALRAVRGELVAVGLAEEGSEGEGGCCRGVGEDVVCFWAGGDGCHVGRVAGRSGELQGRWLSLRIVSMS